MTKLHVGTAGAKDERLVTDQQGARNHREKVAQIREGGKPTGKKRRRKKKKTRAKKNTSTSTNSSIRPCNEGKKPRIRGTWKKNHDRKKR